LHFDLGEENIFQGSIRLTMKYIKIKKKGIMK